MSGAKYHVQLLTKYLTTGDSLVNVSACIVNGKKPLGQINWKSNDPSVQFSQVKTNTVMQMTTTLQIIPSQAHNGKLMFCEGKHPELGTTRVSEIILNVSARSNIFLVLVITFFVFGILMLIIFFCVYYTRKVTEKQQYQEPQSYIALNSVLQQTSKSLVYGADNASLITPNATQFLSTGQPSSNLSLLIAKNLKLPDSSPAPSPIPSSVSSLVKGLSNL